MPWGKTQFIQIPGTHFVQPEFALPRRAMTDFFVVAPGSSAGGDRRHAEARNGRASRSGLAVGGSSCLGGVGAFCCLYRGMRELTIISQIRVITGCMVRVGACRPGGLGPPCANKGRSHEGGSSWRTAICNRAF